MPLLLVNEEWAGYGKYEREKYEVTLYRQILSAILLIVDTVETVIVNYRHSDLIPIIWHAHIEELLSHGTYIWYFGEQKWKCLLLPFCVLDGLTSMRGCFKDFK